MNAALNRPALNMTILVSVIFHLAVLYYLATTWNIIPPISPPVIEPPSVPISRPPLPPPPIDTKPEHQQFTPHHIARPMDTPVPPVPVPEVPPSTDHNGPIIVDHPPPPDPTSIVKPLYPPIALNGEIEGHVRLSITILPDGSVTDVEVVSAVPPGYFEQSAIAAVRRWHYAATGVTRTHVTVDIDYQLTGG